MKLNKLLLTSALCSLFFSLNAQKDSVPAPAPKKWTTGYELGFNVNLSGSSPNWSSGAASSIAGNIFFNHFRNWKNNNKSWDNQLKTNVGYISFTKQDNNKQDYRAVRKNLDQLFFDSKYGIGFKKPKWMSAYVGLNIQSQLLPGYDYVADRKGVDSAIQTSSFMSTGSLTQAVGIEAKPRDWFFVRIGGAAFKQTIVLNQNLYPEFDKSLPKDEYPKIAGVRYGQRLVNEMGFQLQAGLNRDFGKDKMFNLKCNYIGFLSPTRLQTSPVDSRVDLGFVANLGKYVKFNYTLISVFDKDLRAPGLNAWQNSWIVGLGFLTKW